MQLVSITTNVVSSNPSIGKMYSIQQYAIKFVSDLRQVGGFLRALWVPPPIKLTAKKLKYCWKWRNTITLTQAWTHFFHFNSISHYFVYYNHGEQTQIEFSTAQDDCSLWYATVALGKHWKCGGVKSMNGIKPHYAHEA
jgi:hypothetical protein